MKKLLLPAFILFLFAQVLFSASPNERKWLTYANKLYGEGKYAEALSAYSKVIDYNPNDYYSWLYSGYCYLEMKDNGNALLYLEKAYSLQPSEELRKKIEELRLKPLKDAEQNKNTALLRYGLKFGVNFTDISREEAADNFGMKAGFIMGVSMLYGYGGLFSVQAEMMYSQKGGVTEEFNTVFAYDYIEFPVVVKMSFYPLRNVLAGPYIGIQPGIKISASRDGDGIDGISFIDYGLVFGGDISYPVGSGRVIGDVRAALGFNDINEHEYYTDKNFTISFLMGYIF